MLLRRLLSLGFVLLLTSWVLSSAVGRAAPTSAVRPVAHSARTGCFAAPGACGYPDPHYHDVGSARPCPALRHTGSITISRAGTRLENVEVIGQLTVTAPNVTINNVCVSTNARGRLNSAALVVEGRAANTLIEHSTIAGANRSNRSVEIATANWSGGSATLDHDYLYNCGECVHDGPWRVSNSYVISNGMVGTTDHYEDVYCSNTAITLTHDTLLNPEWQTATVFCDTNEGRGGACRNHLTITGSLLAGGDFVLYPCGNATSVGSSALTVVSNRFARCRTQPFFYDRRTGGNTCRGGADSHGYFPYGGYFGINDSAYCPPAPRRRWSRNVWDDDASAVRC